MTESSSVLKKIGYYHWNIFFLHQTIIIIVLLTRYYLTKIDVSDDDSTCRDVNSSDEEGINNQGSQNDSKKYYIEKNICNSKT